MMELKEYRALAGQTLGILIVSALLGFSMNLINPRGYILVSGESQERKNIVFIDTDEAKIKFDHSSALFIDTRDGDDYAASRMKGAISVPAYPESVSLGRLKEHYREISSPLELVLYCGTGCDSSELLAKRLLERGYSRRLYILRGGFEKWAEKGYPVESSK